MEETANFVCSHPLVSILIPPKAKEVQLNLFFSFQARSIFSLVSTFFLFPYIALISAFATQMALLGFIFPLFISPGTCHLMVKDYSRACPRERGKKKEEEEKSPEKTTPP